jgi:hypothetical protein
MLDPGPIVHSATNHERVASIPTTTGCRFNCTASRGRIASKCRPRLLHARLSDEAEVSENGDVLCLHTVAHSSVRKSVPIKLDTNVAIRYRIILVTSFEVSNPSRDVDGLRSELDGFASAWITK